MTIKAGDTSSGSVVPQNDAVKTDKSEETLKERPSRKNKKKEREQAEKDHAEKSSAKSKSEKRLLVLPLEASLIGLLLLVFMGAFYVVFILFPFNHAFI